MTNEKAEARDLPGQQETPRLDGANELGPGFPVDPPSALGGDGPTGREGMERTGHTAREGIRSLRETGRIGPEVRYEDVADGRIAEEVARELGLVP